jgi:hypothetical protein
MKTVLIALMLCSCSPKLTVKNKLPNKNMDDREKKYMLVSFLLGFTLMTHFTIQK